MNSRTIAGGAALGVALALAGTACSAGGPAAPAQLQVKGTMQVLYDMTNGGSDPFSDGTQVVVVNSSNDVIGTGMLQAAGHTSILFYQEDAYKFTVTVPQGETRYGIQVGGISHGTIWESPKQMQAGPSLSLDLTGA